MLTRAALLTALEALPRTAQLTLAVGELHAALTAPSPAATDDTAAPAEAVRAWLPDAQVRPSTDAPRSTVEGLLARLRASMAAVLEVGPELEERDVLNLVRELACFDLTLDRVRGRVQTRVDQRRALPRPSGPHKGRRVRPAAPSDAIAGQEGQGVVDGRKRLAACKRLGIKPKVVTVPVGMDAAGAARSLNLLRTHYTPSQRAAYASKLATLKQGQRADQIGKHNDHPPTIPKAAAMFGVSESIVRHAKRIRRDAHPAVMYREDDGACSLLAHRRGVQQRQARREIASPTVGVRTMAGKDSGAYEGQR